ncbi:MAG: YbaB/EbfC family nucleoid-associated protein [Candidatus Kapaibacteriales bacterium]
MFDLKKLFELQKQMQDKIQESREYLAQKHFEGTSGGGLVVAVVNGNLEVKKISISDEIFAIEQKNFLEVLIASAINDALNKAQESMSKEMGNIIGSLGNLNLIGFNPFNPLK